MHNDNIQDPDQTSTSDTITSTSAPTPELAPDQPQPVPLPEPPQAVPLQQPQQPRPVLGSLSLLYVLISLASMFFTFLLSAITTELHFYNNFPIARLVVWLMPISNLASVILGIIATAFLFTGRKIPTALCISLEIFFFLPLLAFLVTAIAESRI